MQSFRAQSAHRDERSCAHRNGDGAGRGEVRREGKRKVWWRAIHVRHGSGASGRTSEKETGNEGPGGSDHWLTQSAIPAGVIEEKVSGSPSGA